MSYLDSGLQDPAGAAAINPLVWSQLCQRLLEISVAVWHQLMVLLSECR